MKLGKSFSAALPSLLAMAALTSAPVAKAQIRIARLGGLPAAPRARFYVTIEGAKQGQFKGEGSRNKIEGLKLFYEVSSPHDPATGQASGKRQHKAVTITKEWGAATPQLFQALVTNEALKSVLFEFIRTTPQGQDEVYYTVKLTNASVSHLKQYTDESGAELEDVSFTFQRIEIDHRPGRTSASDDWRSNF